MFANSGDEIYGISGKFDSTEGVLDRLFSDIKDTDKRMKAKSKFLLSAGIRGMTFKAKGGNAMAWNYVFFDENDVAIRDIYKYRQQFKDGNAPIDALAEEQLVEDYIKYSNERKSLKSQLQEKQDNSITGRIKKFFNDAYNIITGIIQNKDSIQEFYKDLYNGTFKDAKTSQKYGVNPLYRVSPMFSKENLERLQGKVMTSSGIPITPVKKYQRRVGERLYTEIQSTQENRQKSSILPVQETGGKVSQSKFMQRAMQSGMMKAVTSEMEAMSMYETMNIQDQEMRAKEFVKANPEFAEKVLYGMELAPEGVNTTMLKFALADHYLLQGNIDKFQETAMLTSLGLTRAGQDIVSARGKVNINSAFFLVNEAINRKLEGKQILVWDIEKNKTVKMNINEAIKKNATALEKRIQERKAKIDIAQDYLNKLICR